MRSNERPLRIIKYLGIDFGSSNTSVVGVCEKDSWKENVFLLTDTKHLNGVFPSIMLELPSDNPKPDDYFCFGKAKEMYNEDCIEEGTQIFYHTIKEDLLGTSNEAEARARIFFHRLIERLLKSDSLIKGEDYDLSRLESVYFGFPAYYNEQVCKNYCEKMERILREVFEECLNKDVKIYGAPEPVLAGRAYNAANAENFHEGKTVLVLDLGGYTMDIALLTAEKDADETMQLRNSGCVSLEANSSVPVGKNITTNLKNKLYGERKCSHFDYGLDNSKCELFSGTKDHIDALASYLVNGEENVSYRLQYTVVESATGNDNVITIGFNGTPGTKNISFQTTTIDNAVGFIDWYLTKVYTKVDRKVDYVLFTGGTAKIKPLRDGILQGIKDWLTPDKPQEAELLMDNNNFEFSSITRDKLSSENAVALGAALTAAGICKPLDDMASPSKGKKEDKDKKIEELEAKLKERTMERDLERLKLGELSEAEAKRLVEEYKKRFSSN